MNDAVKEAVSIAATINLPANCPGALRRVMEACGRAPRETRRCTLVTLRTSVGVWGGLTWATPEGVRVVAAAFADSEEGAFSGAKKLAMQRLHDLGHREDPFGQGINMADCYRMELLDSPRLGRMVAGLWVTCGLALAGLVVASCGLNAVGAARSETTRFQSTLEGVGTTVGNIQAWVQQTTETLKKVDLSAKFESVEGKLQGILEKCDATAVATSKFDGITADEIAAWKRMPDRLSACSADLERIRDTVKRLESLPESVKAFADKASVMDLASEVANARREIQEVKKVADVTELRGSLRKLSEDLTTLKELIMKEPDPQGKSGGSR